jgi:hypothetical protein
MNKLSNVLQSRNFFVTIVSIILLVLQYNAIEVDYTAEGIVDMFSSTTLANALVLALVNFINPIMKIVKKLVDKTFDWSFKNSTNFITQVLTLITVVVAVFFDEIAAGMIAALILNVWNLVSHIIKKDEVSQ